MRNSVLLLLVVVGCAFGQDSVSVQFDYRHTIGSKNGIHPRKVLSTRPAVAALGKDEHPYGLGYPVGVTTDNRARVWITDSGTASVHVFDLESDSYREIRRAGDYQLQQPSGIVTDTVGRIYMADSGTGGVYVFDENGEFDRSLFRRGESPLQAPGVIALSQDGRTIYVADPPRNVVVALNREGEVDATIRLPEEHSEPCAISIINNQLYVLAGRLHRVLVLSPAGVVRGEIKWDGIRIPTAFAYNPLERRFFVANPRLSAVQVFDEDGRNLGAFGQYGDAVDQMHHVDSLYLDRSGLVYLIDSHQGKVLVFAESSINIGRQF